MIDESESENYADIVDSEGRCRRTAMVCRNEYICFFFFQAEDGIRDIGVTGVQTCALPISLGEDRESATYQRDLVLRKMFDAGYITYQEYTDAREESLPGRWPAAPMVESGLTGPALTRDFAELAQEELVAKYGANTVLQGDLTVYTTLDLEHQVTAREILYDPSGYLPDPQGPDAALVSLEPETGRISAMVGNRDQRSQFNLATQGMRQPGSAFKPFALIAALEQGIDPETEFVSEEKEYEVDVGTDRPERWKVMNYDEIERGRITLEEALWWSDRSEERRVGKECRSRWSPYH